MTPLDLLTLTLFTWYASYVLVKTDGPFNLFKKLRARVTFGGLLECIICLSVWIAALGYVLLQSPYAALAYIGAIAGGALWGHRYTGWSFDNG